MSEKNSYRRYEIRGRIKGAECLLVNEYVADGSMVARYKAYPLKSGDIPVYKLYPFRGGMTDAGRIRGIKYEKKTINQYDITSVQLIEVNV